MKLKNAKFKFTEGVDGGKSWKGNVKNMLLDISKIKKLGWKPKHNTEQVIKKSNQTRNNQIIIKLKNSNNYFLIITHQIQSAAFSLFLTLLSISILHPNKEYALLKCRRH